MCLWRLRPNTSLLEDGIWTRLRQQAPAITTNAPARSVGAWPRRPPPPDTSGRLVDQRIELGVLALDAVAEQRKELLRLGAERGRIGADLAFRPLRSEGGDGRLHAAHFGSELLGGVAQRGVGVV